MTEIQTTYTTQAPPLRMHKEAHETLVAKDWVLGSDEGALYYQSPYPQHNKAHFSLRGAMAIERRYEARANEGELNILYKDEADKEIFGGVVTLILSAKSVIVENFGSPTTITLDKMRDPRSGKDDLIAWIHCSGDVDTAINRLEAVEEYMSIWNDPGFNFNLIFDE